MTSLRHMTTYFYETKLEPSRLTSACHILQNWTCISIFLVFKNRIPNTELLKPVLYGPITSGSFSPSSADICIINKLEFTQKRKCIIFFSCSWLGSYNFQNHGLVGRCCRIHRLHLCRGDKPPQLVSWIWH